MLRLSVFSGPALREGSGISESQTRCHSGGEHDSGDRP